LLEKTLRTTSKQIERILMVMTLDGTTSTPSIGGDILYGADGIAAFLYCNVKHRRKVYNLVQTNRLPQFGWEP
jgi:hypothetical protein